jgi:hypothetical protein
VGLGEPGKSLARISLILASTVLCLSVESIANAQLSQEPIPSPWPLLTLEELQAFTRHIESEKYYWLSIQSHAWEDCMISKGYDALAVNQKAMNEIESILGPAFDRVYFNATRKIGYHRVVFPFLNQSCHLPNDAAIQQRANQAALDALNIESARLGRYVNQLKAENERLRQDNKLMEAIKSAPYCSQAVIDKANSEKENFYQWGAALQRQLGYSAANLLLDDMISRLIYTRNKCRPILRPIPPAGL